MMAVYTAVEHYVLKRAVETGVLCRKTLLDEIEALVHAKNIWIGRNLLREHVETAIAMILRESDGEYEYVPGRGWVLGENARRRAKILYEKAEQAKKHSCSTGSAMCYYYLA